MSTQLGTLSDMSNAWRSKSEMNLPRKAGGVPRAAQSFRELPVSISAALLDGAAHSDDEIWGATDLRALSDLQWPTDTRTSEEIAASWSPKNDLKQQRRWDAASSSSIGFHEPQLGSSRRSATLLTSIPEQHGEQLNAWLAYGSDMEHCDSTELLLEAGESQSAHIDRKARPIDFRGLSARIDRTSHPIDFRTLSEPHTDVDASAVASSSRGTVKGRLSQLVNTKKIPFTPPIKLERWDVENTFDICMGWYNSQTKSPSIPELSRLVALNFERVHSDAIPLEKRGNRLLPEGAGNDDYYREMIATFLKAAGIEDIAEVLDSFKKTGTGALHRQQVMASSTVAGAVGAVAQIAAATHPVAKTALSVVQLLLTAVTTKLAFDSAELRLRNAGSEEIMPLGKADASPSAKTGPNLLSAAALLAWKLPKIKQCVKRMEKAQARLDAANEALGAANISPQERQRAKDEAQAAGEELNIAFAKFCLRNELKTDYKTASESAKIEYEGNKRYLGVSAASSAFTITSIILGILPHAATAAVTGGVSAAAVAAVALMYVGYQLSSGPSKDGEGKAKRAIVALGKSLDLLSGNAAKQQKARAHAYQTYIQRKRFGKSVQDRAQAKRLLCEDLKKIALSDETTHDIKPLANWEAYADYRQQMEAAVSNPQAMQELEAAFTQTHKNKFKIATLSDAWKTPYRMRLDSMERILLGKSSKTLTALLKSAARAGQPSMSRSEQRTSAQAEIHERLRSEVKAGLRNWIAFQLAKSAVSKINVAPDNESRGAEAALQKAAQALVAIDDVDAQALFTGDGRRQVKATELAKRLTAGEVERYTLTNAGPATLAGAANLVGATVSLGFNIYKDIKLSHGEHAHAVVNHQNDARAFVQGTAPVTTPYNSAERTRFQKTGMAKLQDTVARDGDPVSLKIEIAEVDSSAMDMRDTRINAALDKLVDDLERLADLPDEIKLSIGGRSVATGKLSGTTNYLDWCYRKASISTKAKFQMRRTGMIVNHMHAPISSVVTQAVTQIPLSITRRAINRGQEMSHGVRDSLTRLARDDMSGSVDEEGTTTPSGAVASPGNSAVESGN